MTEQKTLKKVCKCENCGNEAEMVVTCTLVEAEESRSSDAAEKTPNELRRVKGTGTCSHCGNEADMWVDL